MFDNPVWKICERVAEVQALLHHHIECGKHSATEVVAKAAASGFSLLGFWFGGAESVFRRRCLRFLFQLIELLFERGKARHELAIGFVAGRGSKSRRHGAPLPVASPARIFGPRCGER
jgi:hypothetical protein